MGIIFLSVLMTGTFYHIWRKTQDKSRCFVIGHNKSQKTEFEAIKLAKFPVSRKLA